MTKLYFRICTLFVLFIFTNLCQAQKLSTEVRKDFCQNALLNYWYGSDTFKYVMVQSARNIGATNNQEIEIKIENICNDISLQEEFFRLVNSIGGNDDYKFTQFHSLGMTAKNAKELTDYVLSKYNGTSNNKTIRVEVSKNAEFVGGYSNMKKYIEQNINYYIISDYILNEAEVDLSYGENIYDKRVTLNIELLIESDGSPKLKKTKQKLNEETFRELKRVVEGMPKWSPALDENKKPMSFIYIFPLELSLNSDIGKEIVDATSKLDSNVLKYCDGLGGWYYRVEIVGDKIIIEKYPDSDNEYFPNKENPQNVIIGKYLNGIVIIPMPENCYQCSEDITTLSYKITNNIFYELNNEDFYNEYFRCD